MSADRKKMAKSQEMEFPLFDVSLEELKTLMEYSGNEAREKIDNYYGGTEGLCKRLQTDPINGIPNKLEEVIRRRNVFGINQIPEQPPKLFLTFINEIVFWKSSVLFILFSAGLSLYKPQKDEYDYYDYDDEEEDELYLAEIIVVAINIVFVIKARIEYNVERKFRGLQGKINSENKVVVIRGGKQITVIENELVVGDIVLIKNGDKIPADGVLIGSCELKVDGASHNGSYDNTKKSVESDPTVFAGTNVMEGCGRILITAVGLNSQNGIILTLLRTTNDDLKNKEKNKMNKSSTVKWDEENTQPLLENDEQFKNRIHSNTAITSKIVDDLTTKKRSIVWSKSLSVLLQCLYFGLFFAILYVAITMIRFCISNYVVNSEPFTLLDLLHFYSILFTGLIVLLIANPEGIPIALLLSMEYSFNKMKKDNYLIKNMDDCETMGNVTNICIDKTGALTTNKMNVDHGSSDDVPETISICQKAGIELRIVTGDNIITARSVAMSFGILKAGDDFLVLEAKEFNERIRNIDGEIVQEKLDEIWPKLRVLANASPIDKYNLVKGIIDSKINKNREIVAFVGEGTNDCLALKKADIGIVMANSSNYLAKEASDIIITDDNFISLIKAIKWGRNIHDSIAKFLQFYLTIIFVEIVLVFASKLITTNTILTTVQMFWIDLFVSCMGALALAADPPTEDLLERKPYGRESPLISKTIKKNIIGQTIYQLIFLFILIFIGYKFFGIPSDLNTQLHAPPSQHFTIVFNTFALMTFFNIINARKIHGERNVFKDLSKNPLFCTLWIIIFIIHIIIIEFGGHAIYVEPLNIEQWIYCILFGISSIICAQIINTISTKE
ncbi:hypothetical protein ACQ4LE_009717 [Meloidogyne hapla]